MRGVATTKEIKDRFAKARKYHMARIEAAIPLPALPDSSQIGKEIRAGKADIDTEGLKKHLEWMRRDEEAELCVPLTTPSLTKWTRDTAQSRLLRENAIRELDEAIESFLDRVLFDHENAYLALRDLAKWTPESIK